MTTGSNAAKCDRPRHRRVLSRGRHNSRTHSDPARKSGAVVLLWGLVLRKQLWLQTTHTGHAVVDEIVHQLGYLAQHVFMHWS
jgi:hypothetical protein